MWLAAGSNTTDRTTLTADQQNTYANYLQVEPYNQALLPDILSIVMQVIWTFNNGIQFTFPSVANNGLSSNSKIYDSAYNTTVSNYINYGQNYTVQSFSSSLIIVCSVLVNITTNNLMGTLCFNYDGNALFSSAFGQSIIPQTNYLADVYLTLINVPGQIIPNKALSYSPNSNSTLTFYTNTPLFNESSLEKVKATEFPPYWYQNTTGAMQIGVLGTFTYYQCPIMIWTSQLTKVPFFVYIIGSDEVLENIRYDFTGNHLLPVLLAPTILFLVSCLLSWFVLNLIVNKLMREVCVLLNKSKLLIKGDLEIEIPDYDGTLELKGVYEKLKILNELTKFSDERYFKGNNSEKSIKYYRALGFFT
jgi:hypothetical protein